MSIRPSRLGALSWLLTLLAMVLALTSPAFVPGHGVPVATPMTGSYSYDALQQLSADARGGSVAEVRTAWVMHRGASGHGAHLTPSAATGVAAEAGAEATALVAKFSDYLFKEGADHGKDAIFRSYGYSAADSEALAASYEEQAAARYAVGDYQLGKLDQYGQRINITIDLPGQGAAAGRSTQIVSGWMIRSDGSITLNTPFSGFAP